MVIRRRLRSNRQPVTRALELDFAAQRAQFHELNEVAAGARHTFATRLEAAGVSRSDVAEMLGHATSSVTRRYIAPDISRLLLEAEKVVAMRHEPVLRIVG